MRTLTTFRTPLAAALLVSWILARPAAADEARVAELNASVTAALAKPGWTQLPRPVVDVRYSGPTPAAAPGRPPGPVWFVTRDITANSRPRPDERQERAFVASVEAAHAGCTRVVEGGIVLLVDPAGRIWAVAEHTPHLLRCFDGQTWAYKRADGLDAAPDEPAAFARLGAEGKLPRPDYAAGGLRDLNDLGRWYDAAGADAAGNLHFVASCVC